MKLRHKLKPEASRGGRIWHNGGGGLAGAGYSSSIKSPGNRAKLRRVLARWRRVLLRGKRHA